MAPPTTGEPPTGVAGPHDPFLPLVTNAPNHHVNNQNQSQNEPKLLAQSPSSSNYARALNPITNALPKPVIAMKNVEFVHGVPSITFESTEVEKLIRGTSTCHCGFLQMRPYMKFRKKSFKGKKCWGN